eukprot:2322322-Pyramimonas_sp.AAC.1
MEEGRKQQKHALRDLALHGPSYPGVFRGPQDRAEGKPKRCSERQPRRHAARRSRGDPDLYKWGPTDPDVFRDGPNFDLNVF